MKTQTKPLFLQATLPQTKYTVGESISVTVSLSNLGVEPIVVNKRLVLNNRHALADFRELAFIITAPSGKTLQFLQKINVGFTKLIDFKTLMPGDEITRQYALDEAFDLTNPGKYCLKVIYENHNKPEGGSAWSGVIESETIEFEIL